MKTLPRYPYLQNIVAEYHRQHGTWKISSDFKNWLEQFGFAVPVQSDCLEFPDDFSEKELLLFTLRFGG